MANQWPVPIYTYHHKDNLFSMKKNDNIFMSNGTYKNKEKDKPFQTKVKNNVSFQ